MVKNRVYDQQSYLWSNILSMAKHHIYGQNRIYGQTNLRPFRRHEHRAILLDEMQSAEFVVANKKVLQSHVDGAILGQSATQLYTYEIFLWRVPIIITTNNWSYEEFSEADRDWIRSNCVEVCVDSPVWEVPEKPKAHAAKPGRTAEDATAEAGGDTPRMAGKRDAPQRSPKASPPHKREATSCITCGQRLPPGPG